MLSRSKVASRRMIAVVLAQGLGSLLIGVLPSPRY